MFDVIIEIVCHLVHACYIINELLITRFSVVKLNLQLTRLQALNAVGTEASTP